MVIWYTCNPIKAHMSKGEQKKTASNMY